MALAGYLKGRVVVPAHANGCQHSAAIVPLGCRARCCSRSLLTFAAAYFPRAGGAGALSRTGDGETGDMGDTAGSSRLRRVATRAKPNAAANGRDALFAGTDADNRSIVARALDLAEAVAARWTTETTDFLSVPELSDCQRAIARLGEVDALAVGGYPAAERCRLVISRSDSNLEPVEAAEGALAVVEINGAFLFDPAGHRDFLGAVLGTGIQRSKTGDILIQGDRGAHVICTPEMAIFLPTALTSVRSIKVTARSVPLSEIRVTATKVEEVTSFEASLRLDALASAGFRMPRSKMAELIDSGEVRVNWKEATKGSVVLAAGDVISIRGRGRLELVSVELTAKERYKVLINRSV